MDTLNVNDRNRRSRSNTPFILRSNCDHINCGETGHNHEHKKKVKKAPNINPISEELETVTLKNISASSSDGEETEKMRQLKENTHRTFSQMTTTTTVTSNQKNTSNKIIYKKNSLWSKSIEMDQNEKNKELENSQDSSFYNKSGDHNHIAYKEYKDSGEYWNKYPKTDYVYSKLSPHRREIAPGIIAMPNMSRKSLEQHHERVNVMAYNNPEQESYIRKRYQTNYSSNYDSQDEIDLSESDLNGYSKTTYTSYTSSSNKQSQIYKNESIFTSIFTTIFTTFYMYISRIWSCFYSSENDLNYTRTQYGEQGYFRKMISLITNTTLSIFRRIYLLISTVLVYDSWFLQSYSKLKKRGFLIFLLLLLPFLLLCALHQSDNEKNLYLSYIPAISTIFTTTFSDCKNFLTRNFDFTTNQNLKLTKTLQNKLNDVEYNNLILHIEKYIDNELKIHMKPQAINFKDNKDLSLLITNIFNDNVRNYQYELTNVDIERIAEIVRGKIAQEKLTMPSSSDTFSETQFLHISNIVQEKLQTSSQNEFNPKLNKKTNTEIDIDEILLKLISSPILNNLINERIGNNEILSKQEKFIAEILLEIKDLQNKLMKTSHKNDDLELMANILQENHNNLLNRFNLFENENKLQFVNLQNDLLTKISLLKESQYVEINAHVKQLLLEILGYKDENGNNLSNIDIKNWISNTFIAKELLEKRLNDIEVRFDGNIKDELQRSAGILMKNVNDKIKANILIALDNKNSGTGTSGIAIDELEITRIVKKVLSIYDADKTGLVDYALESAGGQILSTRCTESYQTKSAQISVFGIPLWYPSNTPRIAISPAVQPGECWAFQGFPGFLVLQLNSKVIVTGFTLEHIPKSLSPNNKVDSAPKLFTVWGLETENDPEPLLFGQYEFLENGTNLQYFPVLNTNNNIPYQIVELRIESNHGNQQYTCLYRFRVHGTVN